MLTGKTQSLVIRGCKGINVKNVMTLEGGNEKLIALVQILLTALVEQNKKLDKIIKLLEEKKKPKRRVKK